MARGDNEQQPAALSQIETELDELLAKIGVANGSHAHADEAAVSDDITVMSQRLKGLLNQARTTDRQAYVGAAPSQEFAAASSAVTQPPLAQPPVARSLADFEFLRPISEGGAGRVYLARHRDHPTQVYAVKLMSKTELRDKNMTERVLAG